MVTGSMSQSYVAHSPVPVVLLAPHTLQVSVYKPIGSKVKTRKGSLDVAMAADPGRFKGFTLSSVHTYHDLPSHYWKKYQYAAQFVQLVRSKTPKVGGAMYVT